MHSRWQHRSPEAQDLPQRVDVKHEAIFIHFLSSLPTCLGSTAR
jgi:hypothetical protein